MQFFYTNINNNSQLSVYNHKILFIKQKQMIEQQTSEHYLKKRNPSAQITSASNRKQFRSSIGSRDTTNRNPKITTSMHLEHKNKLNLTTIAKTSDSGNFRYTKKNVSLLAKIQRNKTNESFTDENSPPKSPNKNSSSIKDYRRKILRKNIISSLKAKNSQSIFLRKVEQFENQFVQHCLRESYEQAINILVNLLNYTIDLNLTLFFSKALKIIAGFYFFIEKIQSALFYFNQARYCSLLLQQNNILIESLIGMAKCCSKADLDQQSIIILKKALEYAWLYDKKELQLLIYDEIGKKHYHMGEIEIGKKYHLRYINSINQPSTSALKNLSKQRVLKDLQLFCYMRYNQLDKLFLAHLKVPIKKTSQLAPIISQTDKYVRDKININQKYFNVHAKLEQQIKKIFENWFFNNQIDDPGLPNEDWTLPIKLKKFAFIDFKLNQKLKSFKGNQKQKRVDCKRKGVQFKESIQKKVAKKLKEPGFSDDWFQKIALEIKRDHQNKLLHVRDPVIKRGYNKSTKPSIQLVKQLYNEFFTNMDN